MLNKEQIRSAKDRPREFVPIPEWCPEGETFDPKVHGVYVGTLTAKQKDAYEFEVLRRKGNENINVRAMMAVRCVQNEDGTRMFEDAEAEWLGEKAAGPISAIFDVAVRLNSVRKEDQDELVKNS